MTENSASGLATSKRRVVCIGECMIELAHDGANNLTMAFGGDVSNTAVYLARLTKKLPIDTDFVTALGDDGYSDAMLDFWRDEGVGTRMVSRLKGRLPGLYTIQTDDLGERRFTYWRGQSAARDLLREGRDQELIQACLDADLVYLSGITLSILDDAQGEALLSILKKVRAAGGKVAFDGNYRPSGWPDEERAKIWFQKMLEITDMALPTLDDERALFGDVDQESVAEKLHRLGADEVVVKMGKAGCFLSIDGHGTMIEACPVERVIDSTAAGDSFNAGYLAARLTGVPPEEAAGSGHRLASRVVRHRGAVIPLDAMQDLGMMAVE